MGFDFTPMLDVNYNVFGIDAWYTPPDGARVPIRAIDHVASSVQASFVGGGQQLRSRRINVRHSELAVPVQQALVELPDGNFRVKNHEPADDSPDEWTLTLTNA